jgi:hypothetical protein
MLCSWRFVGLFDVVHHDALLTFQFGPNALGLPNSDATTASVESGPVASGPDACVATAPLCAADSADNVQRLVAQCSPAPSWLSAARLPGALAPPRARPSTRPLRARPSCYPDGHAHPSTRLYPTSPAAVRSRPGGRRCSPWPSPARRCCEHRRVSSRDPPTRPGQPCSPVALYSYNLRSHPRAPRPLTADRSDRQSLRGAEAARCGQRCFYADG